LYIATNKLILEDFSVDEYVHVLSKGSIEHLYYQIIYYMKLDSYHCNKYIKIIKALVKSNEQLKEENDKLKRLNEQLTKNIIFLREGH